MHVFEAWVAPHVLHGISLRCRACCSRSTGSGCARGSPWCPRNTGRARKTTHGHPTAAPGPSCRCPQLRAHSSRQRCSSEHFLAKPDMHMLPSANSHTIHCCAAPRRCRTAPAPGSAHQRGHAQRGQLAHDAPLQQPLPRGDVSQRVLRVAVDVVIVGAVDVDEAASHGYVQPLRG